MRVGIMSMQRVRNYGSFLQAYGLKRILESQGHTVEFIDYKLECPVKENTVSGPPLNLKTIFRYLEHRSTAKKRLMYSNASKFDSYYDTFLPLLGVSETNQYNTNVDTLVIGSDEVFNCFQNSDDKVDSFELFGANNNANKCISYAASFGSTTLEKINNSDDKKRIEELLSTFDGLSVRDENSYSILKSLTRRDDIHMNLDPVLMYDFDKEIVESKQTEPYIVVYSYRGRITDKEGQLIKKFAKKKGMKLICVGGVQGFCDEYLLCSPFEVLGLFKNASYIITDTFHGTVMSLKYGRPFATIIRDNNRQKLSDLLQKFDLGDRVVNDMKELENVAESPYDFTAVQQVIEIESKKTREYLSNNV